MIIVIIKMHLPQRRSDAKFRRETKSIFKNSALVAAALAIKYFNLNV